MAAAVVTVPALSALAVEVVPPTPRTGSLVEVGPVGSNGFPTWYRDKNADGATSRLELCLPLGDVPDPFCAPPVNPLPLVYPTNFPDENFYQLATGAIATGGVNVLVEMNLEGAYATGPVIPGDEMVFGRIRIRDKAVADGTTWRITHPYGIDEITAAGGRGINMTQDVGTTPGAFGGALGSRIGPFLKWDAAAPAAPAGYTGDPAILHTVVGSPYNTNFLKIERKNADGSYTQIGFTDLFSVQGRYATNSGVDVARATYSLQGDGNGTVDVFASSETDQSIQVNASPLGFANTSLVGEQGRYFGRLALTSAHPVAAGATIEVVNAGDRPVATKTVPLTDGVTIASAVFTAGAAGAPAPANTLTVTATSSDALNNPILTVDGFNVPLVGGTVTIPTIAPPPSITVKSARGGSATIATTVAGAGLAATTPVASFTAPLTSAAGEPITMDAAASSPAPLTYAWTQLPGSPTVTLTGAATPLATFTPTVAGSYTMQLVVTGPTGTASVPVTRTITVTPPAPTFVPNAGPDQTVQRGKVVTLDASATVGAQSLAWTQTGGPTMALSSTTAAKPTFTYAFMPLPNALPGNVNTGYVANNTPLTFTLTATPVGGGAVQTDTVVISPQAESFSTVVARYRTTRGEWRVTGTSSILAGQRVTIVLGPNAQGRTIGSATVDAAGAFSVRAGAAPDPRSPGQTLVTVVSGTGGVASFPLSITT
ncbi:MAG: PKD domain-containing protein [Ornithinibacter sp.]